MNLFLPLQSALQIDFSNTHQLKPVIVWSQKGNNILKELKPVALDEDVKDSICVYPNPVVNKKVNLQFNNMAAGSYTLLINNLQGQREFSSIVKIAGPYQTNTFQLPATLSSGKYLLSIKGAKGLVKVLQL